jgi:hypothetical protein
VLFHPLYGILELHILALLISQFSLAKWALVFLLRVLANTSTATGVPALQP